MDSNQVSISTSPMYAVSDKPLSALSKQFNLLERYFYTACWYGMFVQDEIKRGIFGSNYDDAEVSEQWEPPPSPCVPQNLYSSPQPSLQLSPKKNITETPQSSSQQFLEQNDRIDPYQ